MSEATPRRRSGSGSAAARAPMARGVRARAIESEAPSIPGLTPEQLAELRTRLDERRATLLATFEEKRERERDTGREVGDEMDEANIEGVTAMNAKLLERDAQLLAEIDRALVKMRDGTYGTCEGTGEPIGYARLSLRPWARYSVEYQEELEREARTRGGA